MGNCGSYYAHLNTTTLQRGNSVKKGDLIGLSGSSGRSTGPHLHYEVRDTNGTSVNPSTYLTMEDVETTDTSSSVEIPSMDNTEWYDVKGKIKVIIFNIFKFIIIALLIILFVVFITKALDINIL